MGPSGWLKLGEDPRRSGFQNRGKARRVGFIFACTEDGPATAQGSGGDIMLAEWHDEGDGIWKEEQSKSAPRRMTEGARSGQCLELTEADMRL